jgi:hypothetical protein
MKLNTKNILAKESELVVDHKANETQKIYSGTSVQEFNSFLETVHHPKCS